MTHYFDKAVMLLNGAGATAWAAVLNAWRGPTGRFDNYRPEAHYMRGPGPKWRAKHAQLSVYPVFSNTKTPASSS